MKSVFLLTLIQFLLCCLISVQAQEEKEEIIRVNTSVVIVDTLVRDLRTGASVTDLTRENFELFDNGRRREITYFSRAGDGRRRPLALFPIMAPLDDGARKNFQRPDVVNSLAAASENYRGRMKSD